jgi:hypothetical protein
MRKRAGIAVLRVPRRPFSSESIWRLRVTKFGTQIFLLTDVGSGHVHVLQIDFLSGVVTEATATFMLSRLLVMSYDGGYGHVHVKLTSCHEL